MSRMETAGFGTVDGLGRFVTVGTTRLVTDGPTFTILAGQTVSNQVVTYPALAQNGNLMLFDDPARLAAETISLDIARVTPAVAADFRRLITNMFTATLNVAVSPSSLMFASREIRLVSAAAVGADRTFFSLMFA